MRRLSHMVVSTVLTFLLWGLAYADTDNKPLSVDLKVFQVVKDQSGKESLVPVQQASTGDVLEYSMTYKNNSQQALEQLKVVGPVPTGTVYLKDSASTQVASLFEVTIDQGQTWHKPPLYEQVTLPDGKAMRRMVEENRYNLIRWTLMQNLAVGKEGIFTYRIKVS